MACAHQWVLQHTYVHWSYPHPTNVRTTNISNGKLNFYIQLLFTEMSYKENSESNFLFLIYSVLYEFSSRLLDTPPLAVYQPLVLMLAGNASM